MRAIGALYFSSLIFFSSFLFAQDDYEVIGRFRKKTYDGFASKIAAELFEEGTKSNRLFESMNVELDLSLGPVTGKVRYARSVNVDNPKVEEEVLSPYDYSEYRVSNTIFTGIDVDAHAGVLRSEAQAGVFFGVSKKVVPRHSSLMDKIRTTDSVEDICRMAKKSYNPFLNPELKKVVTAKDCTENEKGFSEWFEEFVEALNKPVRNILMDYLADSEKVKMYADQPFEALTNYTRYGFPMDLSLFYDSNKMLSVGDSVQHSVFYGWNPLSIGANFGLGHTSLSAIKNTHAVRDFRIRKEGNNVVTVQVTDYLEKGKDWQWLKLRPRLLLLFKYTFVDWRDRDFDSMTFRRTYRIDLSQGKLTTEKNEIISGLDFLKDILAKGYFVDLELSRERMSEPVDLPVGVTAYEPIFLQGQNATYNFMARFPGIFKIDKRDKLRVQQAWMGEDKTQAESHREHSLAKKWQAFEWLGIDKTDRNTRCSVNTKTYADDMSESTFTGALSNKLAMNLDCYHSERYPNKDWLGKAWDTSYLMANGKVEPEFRERLFEIENPQSLDLQYVSNVSFNSSHLNNIIEAIRTDKNRVAIELVDIYLGEKYRKIWEEVGNVNKIFSYYRTHANDYPIYTHQLERYAPLFCDKTPGILGTRMGFLDFQTILHDKDSKNVGTKNPCHRLVLDLIAPLSKDFNAIANIETQNIKTRTDAVLRRLEIIGETYDQRDMIFAISQLLQRLAGENDRNPVHLTYSVDSFSFLEPIVYSNGDAFRIDHESISDVIPDVLDFVDDNHRITNVLLMKRAGVAIPTSLRLDLLTTHQFPRESLLEVEVREFVSILKNEDRSEIDRDLTAPKTIARYTLPLSDYRNLDKLVNGAKYVYENIRIPSDRSWESGKNGKIHVMYLRVKNQNQEWLSEEAQVHFLWQ